MLVNGNFIHKRYCVLQSTDDITYTAESSVDFNSIEVSDGMTYSVNSKEIVIEATVANGAFLYIRWTGDDVSGSGSRDEFGLDNVVISKPIAEIGGTYWSLADALSLAVSGDVVTLFNNSTDQNLTIPMGVTLQIIDNVDYENTSTFINNGTINCGMNSHFRNSGTYKGNGLLNGEMVNLVAGILSPGN